MRRKDVIKRILLLAVWVMVMAGITTLLIAANRKQKAHLCNELIIGMRGGNGLYLDKSDIIRLIEKTSGNVLNRHIAKIRIARLERNLELNPWIKMLSSTLTVRMPCMFLLKKDSPLPGYSLLPDVHFILTVQVI